MEELKEELKTRTKKPFRLDACLYGTRPFCQLLFR